jgi:hypothetical protein
MTKAHADSTDCTDWSLKRGLTSYASASRQGPTPMSPKTQMTRAHADSTDYTDRSFKGCLTSYARDLRLQGLGIRRAQRT